MNMVIQSHADRVDNKSLNGVLEPDPFDLVLGEPLLRPVLKLGRPRALMRGHSLSVIESAAVGFRGETFGRCLLFN